MSTPPPEDQSSFDTEIGRSVRELRQSRGLTQGQLAVAASRYADVDLHQQTVVRIETGLRPLRFREAYAIAAALGVNVDALGGEPSASSPWTARVVEKTSDVEILRTQALDLELRIVVALNELRDFIAAADETGEGLDPQARSRAEAALRSQSERDHLAQEGR